MQGSEFPDLFMVTAEFNYDGSFARISRFKEEKNPYKGFVFDFSKVRDSEGSVIMLDTPGMWEASITLINTNNAVYNVQGLIRFNVATSVSWVDDNPVELDYSVITHNIAEALSNVLFKDDKRYLRAHENFISAAENGELLKAIYVPGSLVYDEATNKTFVINSVEPNPENPGRVSATYTVIGPFGTDIEASPTNPLKLINDETQKFELLLTDVYSSEEVSNILNNNNEENEEN